MESNSTETVYKAGFVAVMGRPNVGKSTLVNALLAQKIAAVSPRPQTTRKRQMGILTLDSAQVIFIDTPGVHRPLHKLGESMNQEAIDTLEESDVILFLVDVSVPPHPEDELLVAALREVKRRVPTLLAMNKMDLVDHETLEMNRRAYEELIPHDEALTLSAVQGQNLDRLLERILAVLPQGEPFFPEGQVTDLYERDIAADLIREAALILLRDEVPHGIAIRVDQYTEREEHGAYIEATIFVEKESHKPIVIGQGGAMLKKIGSMARQEIEAMSGRKVFLRLRVKVRKNWRNDENILKRFGY
ncbi:MAG: GTPase Era [Chloroflexi bacterium]|nr:GTPase Era [Chloroflexota bacterium]